MIPLLRHFIGWDPGSPPSEVLRDDDGSCQCVSDKMKSFANAVNSANIPYNPFSTNSNAFAFGERLERLVSAHRRLRYGHQEMVRRFQYTEEIRMRLVVSILALAAMCGCSRTQNFDCVDQLKTRVPIGSSIDAAEMAVKECGLEYSLDRSGRVLHGVKRGAKKGITQESRVVLIKFDDADKVSSVEVKAEFTGP
jgi:hypothetical protein